VAFEVSVAPTVIEYLNNCDRLTESDRARVIAGIFDELGANADQFLAKNPHPFLPDRYWYDFSLMTEAREFREFVFACSAEGHVFGLTEVLYTEERREESD
jgi:hypothetical protein